MNQQTNIDSVQTEYHICIRLLSPNIPRPSIDSMMNFMGFLYFQSIHDYINAKTFSRMLRVPQGCTN